MLLVPRPDSSLSFSAACTSAPNRGSIFGFWCWCFSQFLCVIARELTEGELLSLSRAVIPSGLFVQRCRVWA